MATVLVLPMTIMGKDENPKMTILTPEELADGKTTEIAGLEITGWLHVQ